MHFRNYQIFTAFLLLRLSSVYFVQSSFVPDEYWQSLEVSHKLAFGYGYLTWEWDKRIRSCFYPYIIHLLYKILPDSSFFIIYSPKLLQAVLSSVGDFFVFKLATDYFGKSCGIWTAFNVITSWFLFYCSARTLSNMAEASLTACGFYFYPWPKRVKYRLSSKYLWFAGISTLIRPTAVVTWFPLYIWHIFRAKNVFVIIWNTSVIGCIILAGMLLIDKWCFNELVFTPYNFFIFNWSNDIGAFYGSHIFLWYFLIGLPTVLGPSIILFVCGIMLPQLKQFYCLILWVLIFLSVPSHKEFRFLLPILHLCMIINGVVMNELWHGRMRFCKVSDTVMKFFSALLILTNGSVSLYMGLYHQRGVIDVTHYLSKTVNEDSSVLFLMPCHSTPYFSYVHKQIQMKFLTCDPNFTNDENFIEEADEFFVDPPNWLYKNYELNNASSLPSHVVMFDTLYPSVSVFLNKYHYKKCFSTFHSHFAKGRTGKFVYIYCK